MRVHGKVYEGENELGNFTVYGDDQVVVDFNGGRWSAYDVFKWASDRRKDLTFKMSET